MSEPAKNLETVRQAFRVSWSEHRARSVRYAVMKQARRRRLGMNWLAILLSTGALATACIALWVVSSPRAVDTLDLAREADSHGARGVGAMASHALQFRDGSRARLLTPTGDLRLIREDDGRIEVALASGRARFDVVARTTRRFGARSADVWVSVMGARFVMEPVGPRTWVSVEEGSVDIAWAGGAATLSAGTQGLFPPDARVPPEPAAPPVAAHKAQKAQVRAPKTLEWRVLARKGDYERAYEALAYAKEPDVRDEPADLLLAADVARLSQHPARAVDPLQRLLARFPRDPRAPVAAFTLGRVLSDELGKPKDGARAFALAERLGPSGTLAADALARQAEAWAKAGEQTEAALAARRYLHRHPTGQHVPIMQRLAGAHTTP